MNADEPTNDADVDLLRSLEDGIMAWPGTVMCISHDRYFLDRICSHILAFEGDSQVRPSQWTPSSHSSEPTHVVTSTLSKLGWAVPPLSPHN